MDDMHCVHTRGIGVILIYVLEVVFP